MLLIAQCLNVVVVVGYFVLSRCENFVVFRHL